MPDPLEVVATRIAQLGLRVINEPGPGKNDPMVGRIARGPVLSVVRDTTSGKIYIGVNEESARPDTPEVLRKAIAAQKQRIAAGEVIVVRTAPNAPAGGHSEVTALTPAVNDYERRTGKKLAETDLHIFELHNVYLEGGRRALTTAPRCEHCARIVRGVRVTQSLFRAEGGVIGEVNVPQRGLVIPAGGGPPKHVTTTGGEIAKPGPTAGGSIGGNGIGIKTMLGGVLTSGGIIAGWMLEKWLFDSLRDKFEREAQAMIAEAIQRAIVWYSFEVARRLPDIYREKSAGRLVRLRVDLDTDWTKGALVKARVFQYCVVFEGDREIIEPLKKTSTQVGRGFFNAPKVTHRRDSYYFPL